MRQKTEKRKAQQRACSKAYRAAQQAAGLCWGCPLGVPTVNPKTGARYRRCQDCRRRASEWYQASRRKHE